MELLKSLNGALQGKRTFLVGIVSIILGLLQGDTQLILQGLGFIGLRLAI